MAKKKGDRTDLLTKEEMDKLLLVVSSDIYFAALYNVLLHTGRRIGEIYGTLRGKELTGGIRVKDIDFPNKQMTTLILKTKKRRLQVECPSCKQKTTYKSLFCPNCAKPMPKIDKEQLLYSFEDKKTISLKDNLIILLKMYIKKANKKQNDYLFRELSLSYLKKVIKKHIKTAGITKNFSIHGFRHYFITACKRAGMSNEDVAKWTGHIRPETLNTYNRLVPKDIEKKIFEVEL